MIKSYQRLFQLDIFHTYFKQDICRCLEFNAEPATEQLMKRFRFLVRRQINGIGIYSNSEQSIEQLLLYIEQVTGQNSFCFEIRTNNPDFNFFTELPANWVGQIRYTSNNSTIVDNNVQLNQELSGNAGTLCLGKVTLRFDDILKFSKQSGYTQFNIHYQARATQWQYFVINRSLVPLSNPAIAGKEPISFEGPENVLTPDGHDALLFSSGANLIPMSEQVRYKFDLINRPETTITVAGNKMVAPQVIINGLPTPVPEWIGKTVDNTNEQISSPMYIYL
jgi:hypothetical protein